MQKASTEAATVTESRALPFVLLPRVWLFFAGRTILRFVDNIHGLGAFALIALGVTVTKFNSSSKVVHPLIFTQIFRSGVRLLPMIGFLAFALGLVVIGQTVSWLTRYGAQNYLGTVMVIVVVRELGPIITALVVLARVGTATVIDLGTARALGEVEVLESLGIDPIHYLVMPRLIGLAVSIFSLTVYLILIALVAGYLFAFIQDIPLRPDDYFAQLAAALNWEDFLLLALKTFAFGVVIANVTCFQGLAQPLHIEEVSGATTRAVTHSVIGVVLIDAFFIIIYLVM